MKNSLLNKLSFSSSISDCVAKFPKNKLKLLKPNICKCILALIESKWEFSQIPKYFPNFDFSKIGVGTQIANNRI